MTRENRSSGFPTRSDTNRPVQSQKQARSSKFWILEEEKLYYLCSENKGADQLRSYCEADLRLCFRIGKNPVFSRCGSIKSFHIRLIRLKMLSKFIQSKFVKLSFMLDRNEIKSKRILLNRWSIWLHKCYLIPAECHLLA